MDGKDLVKIIEACGKNGVTLFKQGDLEMHFNGFVNYNEKDYSNRVDQIRDVKSIDPKFEEQFDFDMSREEDADLILEDPAKYEEYIYKEYLEDNDNDEYMDVDND